MLYASWWHSKLIHPNPNKKEVAYLTATPNPGAGIGHQMANWIAGLWYSKVFGLQFTHTPFTPDSWEIFLGLGEQYPQTSEMVKTQRYKKVRLPMFDGEIKSEVDAIKNIISSYRGKKVIFILEQDQFYRDQYGVMHELRSGFHKAKSRTNDKLIFSKSNFNVCIHVRRGDIVVGQQSGHENLTMRWQDLSYFQNTLRAVLAHVKPSNPIKIHVFSEASPAELTSLESVAPVEYCCSMSAPDSFLHMVNSDLLISSKSSFSYKPALLSFGIKLCPRDFWHGYPSDPDWIMVENDGCIDAPGLEALRTATNALAGIAPTDANPGAAAP